MSERTPGFGFSLLGVPVRVEAWFFVLPLLVLQRRDLKGALIWSGVVFVTVMLHELGHALALRAYGFDAAIALHGLGGTTSSPSGRHSTPPQDFFITLAGPGAGLVSGLPVLAAHAVVSVPNPDIALVMSDWVWVSVGWSLVNLLPILPWDGGNLFAAGLEWGTGKPQDRLVALSSIVVGLLIVASALSMSEPLLGYFGVMGLVFGYQRWVRVPSEDELKQELEAQLSRLITAQLFDEALALSRAHESLAYSAANKLFDAGAFAQALEVCTSARVRTGNGVHAYNEACCLCRLGRFEEAVTALREAKRLGYAELGKLRTEEDLAAVRERPEVLALLN